MNFQPLLSIFAFCFVCYRWWIHPWSFFFLALFRFCPSFPCVRKKMKLWKTKNRSVLIWLLTFLFSLMSIVRRFLLRREKTATTTIIITRKKTIKQCLSVYLSFTTGSMFVFFSFVSVSIYLLHSLSLFVSVFFCFCVFIFWKKTKHKTTK